jgi:hypothetical protein
MIKYIKVFVPFSQEMYPCLDDYHTVQIKKIYYTFYDMSIMNR